MVQTLKRCFLIITSVTALYAVCSEQEQSISQKLQKNQIVLQENFLLKKDFLSNNRISNNEQTSQSIDDGGIELLQLDKKYEKMFGSYDDRDLFFYIIQKLEKLQIKQDEMVYVVTQLQKTVEEISNKIPTPREPLKHRNNAQPNSSMYQYLFSNRSFNTIQEKEDEDKNNKEEILKTTNNVHSDKINKREKKRNNGSKIHKKKVKEPIEYNEEEDEYRKIVKTKGNLKEPVIDEIGKLPKSKSNPLGRTAFDKIVVSRKQ